MKVRTQKIEIKVANKLLNETLKLKVLTMHNFTGETKMDIKTQKAVEFYWDYIIIGTGMGGSVIGLSLAKVGKKILFCEKGLALEKLNEKGSFPEMSNSKNTSDLFKRAGRRSQSIVDLSYKTPREFIPFIGEGAGGSSLLYGMAMERGHVDDFKCWPITYKEIEPYYQEAEILFGVAPSKSLCAQNQIISDFLVSNGLTPYKLPLASQQKLECQGCQGQLCSHNNKNHAGNCALQAALNFEGNLLLDECEVVSLIENSNKITNVIIKRNNQTFRINGNNVVLAAGALETPRILFKSSTIEHSNGLANSSGKVGKNLMRHLIDLYLLEASEPVAKGIIKELAFNDFYRLPEGKGGTVQSFGYMPPVELVLQDIFRDLSFQSKFVSRGLQILSPFLKFFLNKLISNSVVFASIVEDSPCEDNQVLAIRDQTSFIYKVKEADQIRLKSMRKKLQGVFKSKLKMKIFSGGKNTLLAHACGTCRMGIDSKDSVVDKNGKCHDISNLFIADASVFPTSLGVNPALTIAANAIRMAHEMAKGKPAKTPKTQCKVNELQIH